jgi:hypothetical protein
MFRSMLYSLVMLGVVVGFAAAADKKNADKKGTEAKITKVDAKKGTVTVTMQIDGKDVEKTFKLAENIEYADSTGKVAVIDIFTSGDMVLMFEEDGKVTKLKKCDKSATEKKPNSK